MLAIPLREGGTPTGVLVVAHGEPDGFDDGDLRLLELFSGMAASVLHRAQVEHSLAVTHAIAQAASVDATLESGLSGSLRVLTGRLGWDAAAIWLESDDHDGALTCRSHLIDSGLPAQQLEQSFAGVITPADPSPAWAAFAGGGSLWIDLTREPRPVTTAAGCGIATAVFVPLRSHGRPIGVLELLQRSPQAGGAAELGLLETLAAQIANFVARRLAEAQLVTQADNLAAVVALSQMIASVPVSHVRETMCVEIARLARVDVACLYEPDGKGGLLVTGQAGDAALPDGAVAATGTLAGQAFAAGSGRFIAAGELASHEADELIARIGFGWCHLQPVLRDGEVVAVLVLGARAPRMRPVAGLAELASLLAAETATTLALADLVRALDARARTDELTGLANRRAREAVGPAAVGRDPRPRPLQDLQRHVRSPRRRPAAARGRGRLGDPPARDRSARPLRRRGVRPRAPGLRPRWRPPRARRAAALHAGRLDLLDRRRMLGRHRVTGERRRSRRCGALRREACGARSHRQRRLSALPAARCPARRCRRQLSSARASASD